jgi:hypothetical protein
VGKKTIMRPDRGRTAGPPGGPVGVAKSRAVATRDAGWCLQSRGAPSYNRPQHSGLVTTWRKAWASRKPARAVANWDKRSAGCGPASAIARADTPARDSQVGAATAPPGRPCLGRPRCHRPTGTTRTASRSGLAACIAASRFSLPRLMHGVGLLGFVAQTRREAMPPGRRPIRCVRCLGAAACRDACLWP